MLHKNGRAIQSFTTKQFYQMPKRARRNDIMGLLRVGMVRNLGEKYAHQLFMPYKLGKRLF